MSVSIQIGGRGEKRQSLPVARLTRCFKRELVVRLPGKG